ncbi:MAG TPA: ABC transporter permease [Vicinamibacterales bacterium]|jgi:predicted permease
MDWNSRVRAAFGSSAPSDDVVEELAQHAAAAFEAARAEGLDADTAARGVESQIDAWAGDERVRTRRPRSVAAVEPPPASAPWLAGVGHDVRYAWQLLRRQWGHTLVVGLTVALGVGASTVLFSVAYGVLVKPIPWRDAGRLVRVYETRQGSAKPPTFFTNATYLAWADHPATIEGIAAWSTDLLTLVGAGEPERIRVVSASPELFPLLGATPALGRLFTTSADGALDEKQIVLSHGLWQARFNASPQAIGRVVRLDGEDYHVAAVMPASFAFPDREIRAWVPFQVRPAVVPGKSGGGLSMFSALARLRPGATAAQAAAEASARGNHAPDPGLVVMAVFGSRGAVQVSAVPFLESMTGDVRPALIVFLVAVGLLLVTATANVASLQLARTTARRREIAIRSALGAGTGRLARQLLIENAILGQVGGLAGLVLAAWLVHILPSVLPPDFPRLADIGIDWRVALVAVALSLTSSLGFGLAPVLHARRVDLAGALSEDSLSAVGAGHRTTTARARLAIMVGQVAVACVLLVGAALLVRSMVALLDADRGYDPTNVLTARLSLRDGAYPGERRVEVLDRLVSRLRAVPGVKAAAYASNLPLVSGNVLLAAFPVPARKGGGMVPAHATVRHVSPGYFSALGLRVVEGRAFIDADTHDSKEVTVVNRAFARQYLDTPAVGVQLPGQKAPREVIGVIENARFGAVSDVAQPEAYDTVHQVKGGLLFDTPAIVVRTAGDPTRLVPILRSFVREQDATLALDSVMTMEDRVWNSLSKPRLYALLLGVFAAFALTIAAVGLFGVLSYGVSLRAREIGVRTSLGATPWVIARLVVRQGLAVTVTGAVIGLALSAAGARYLSKLLYGVTPYDAATFVLAPVLLTIVALIACLVPARRAARVDPVKVLR